MPKTSNVKTTAEEELAKLNAFHEQAMRELQPRLEEERQAALAEQRKAEEVAIAEKTAEAAEIAKHLIENVSPKADRLLSELVKVLIERRDLGRDLATRYRDVSQVGNQLEYSANHETASAELIALWGRRHNGRSENHQTYTDIDQRIVHRLYMKKGKAA